MSEGRIATVVRPPDIQKAYVCLCVFRRAKPVKLVSRHGAAWAILCGELHPDDADYYRVVGIGHEFDKDPTLLEVVDLAPEWDAERLEVGGPWIRTPSTAS